MQIKATGVDIKLFGGLFMIVGAVDLVIIVLFPSYGLKLFGAVVTGSASSSSSSTLRLATCLSVSAFCGFARGPGGLVMAYGGFGIVGEVMNQAAFGLHPTRTALITSTLVFPCYLIWRRSLFSDMTKEESLLKQDSQGAP